MSLSRGAAFSNSSRKRAGMMWLKTSIFMVASYYRTRLLPSAALALLRRRCLTLGLRALAATLVALLQLLLDFRSLRLPALSSVFREARIKSLPQCTGAMNDVGALALVQVHRLPARQVLEMHLALMHVYLGGLRRCFHFKLRTQDSAERR